MRDFDYYTIQTKVNNNIITMAVFAAREDCLEYLEKNYPFLILGEDVVIMGEFYGTFSKTIF